MVGLFNEGTIFVLKKLTLFGRMIIIIRLCIPCCQFVCSRAYACKSVRSTVFLFVWCLPDVRSLYEAPISPLSVIICSEMKHIKIDTRLSCLE